MQENQVIEFMNPEKWVHKIINLLESERITIPNNAELKKWGLTDHVDNVTSEKILKLFSKFYIRAYHACRPIDVNDYYRHGLKIPDTNMYYELYDEYIKRLNIRLTREQYERGRTSLEASGLDKKIYFHFQPYPLLNFSGHYLVYGSEKMVAAFVTALQSESPHDFLENQFGQATLLEINVPINMLDKVSQKLVCGHALFCLKQFVNNKPYETDSCAWINNDLPAKYIAAHTHPKEGYNAIKHCRTLF